MPPEIQVVLEVLQFEGLHSGTEDKHYVICSSIGRYERCRNIFHDRVLENPSPARTGQQFGQNKTTAQIEQLIGQNRTTAQIKQLIGQNRTTAPTSRKPEPHLGHTGQQQIRQRTVMTRTGQNHISARTTTARTEQSHSSDRTKSLLVKDNSKLDRTHPQLRKDKTASRKGQ